MKEEKQFRFLPLGTFVKVAKRGDQIYMVVARALTKDKEGNPRSNYRLAEHPKGDVKGATLFMATDMDVVEVIQEGYSDESDQGLLEDKLERLKEAPAVVPKKEVNEIPEPDFTKFLDMGKTIKDSSTECNVSQGQEDSVERLENDPFYKFKQKG